MKKSVVILLCVCSLFSMTGCSGKEELPETIVDNFEESDHTEEANPGPEGKINSNAEESAQDTKDENSSTSGTGQEKISEETGTEVLEGNVTSIGTESVVICKAYIYEEDEGLIMVSSADDSGNETLVTVNLPEGVKWELHTVKNGGVNGDDDVTISEASFSDIKEGVSVKFTGYYVTEEKEFTADSVVIYSFV